VIYIDTSLFMRALLVGSADHLLASALIRTPQTWLASSELLWLEADRAAVRLADENPAMFAGLAAEAAAALRNIDMIPLDRAVIDAARAIPQVVKSLDAIHIASAETLGHELGCLATYDKTMTQVATRRGLLAVTATGALSLA